MKVRENAEFEKEGKERKSNERRSNISLCQKNLRWFESAQKKEEKQKKEAKRKATKRLLESLEVREERLQKDTKLKAAERLLHPWELGPSKVLRLYCIIPFFPPFFTSMFDKRLSHQQNITIKLKMCTG